MSNIDTMFPESEKKFPSDFYKIKEGVNRMRILTDFSRVDTMQEGKTYKGIFRGTPKELSDWIEEGETDEGKSVRRVNTRGWAWAIVRSKEGDEFKIVQFGKRIISMIRTLKESEDWGFKNFPMEYDIDVNAKGAGTTEVIYAVMPSKPSKITDAEKDTLKNKKTIGDIIDRIYEKQTGKAPKSDMKPAITAKNYPKDDISPDDIPF